LSIRPSNDRQSSSAAGIVRRQTRTVYDPSVSASAWCRDYLRSALPGSEDFPISRIVEPTSAGWGNPELTDQMRTRRQSRGLPGDTFLWVAAQFGALVREISRS